MPLSKAPVFVPLGAGLRMDTADLLLKPGLGTLFLENGVYSKTGQISKRKGSAVLSNERVSFGSISASWQLATYKGSLVSLGYPGGDPVAMYSPETSKWATAIISTLRSGLDGALAIRPTPLNRTDGVLTSVWSEDVTVAGGYVLTAYNINANRIIFDVFDQITGQRVKTFETAGQRARCIYVSGKLIGVFIDMANVLKVAIFTIATIGATPTVATLVGAANPLLNLEVIKTPSDGFGVLYQRLTGELGEVLVTSALVATDWTVTNNAAVPVTPDLMFTYVKDVAGTGTRDIVSFSAAAGAEAHVGLHTVLPLTQQATSTVSLSTVAAAKTANNNGATAYNTGAPGPSPPVVAVWEYLDVGTQVPQIWTSDSGGTLAFMWAKLASKVWLKNASVYMLIEEDGSFFVVRPTQRSAQYPAPIAIALRGEAGLPSRGRQSNVATVNDNPFGMVVPTAPEIQVVLGSAQSVTGADFLRLDYEQTGAADPITGEPWVPLTSRPAEAIGSLFVATGSQLCQFDGRNYGEVSFPGFPEIISATAGAIGGAALTPNSDYRYQIVWARRDNNGLWWRSAPSVPVDVHTGAGPSVSVSVVYKNCTLSGWDPDTMFVEVYRSLANESEEMVLVERFANNRDAVSTTFNDVFSDDNIQGDLPLYTNDGILESSPLPGTKLVLNALNRLWIVDADDPTKLWVSNLFVDGEGARFNEDNVITLREVSATPITALSYLDDKLIVFKEDRIYVLTGDGPDAAGNGAFNVFTVMGGVGTKNPQSVVAFPDGNIFQSGLDYELLDRGLSLATPIQGTASLGQSIRPYALLQIRGGIHLPALGQVRLYGIAGTTLVWDYIHSTWSTFTAQPAATATAYKGLGAYYNQTGAAVYTEDVLSYQEGPTLYALSVLTPWLSFETIEGCERIYRIQGVGETAGDHTIEVTTNYDGDRDAVGDTRSRVMLATEVIWPWELRPRRQKVSSMLLLIREQPANATAGPVIKGISLVVGVKQGLRKQSAPLTRLVP